MPTLHDPEIVLFRVSGRASTASLRIPYAAIAGVGPGLLAVVDSRVYLLASYRLTMNDPNNFPVREEPATFVKIIYL